MAKAKPAKEKTVPASIRMVHSHAGTKAPTTGEYEVLTEEGDRRGTKLRFTVLWSPVGEAMGMPKGFDHAIILELTAKKARAMAYDLLAFANELD